MQRGKAPVQHYQGDGPEMLKALESGTDEANSIDNPGPPPRCATASQPAGEMAGHIVDQLRRAYDELLHEPVPDHLRQLLANLSEVEDKS
jgi:Anti-sigma factor NepR